jgi:hypothetical protein
MPFRFDAASTRENVAESRERTNAITDELGRSQDWRRKDRAGDAPQPKPEHEREDHQNRIERESSGEKHRRHRLAFDHMDGAIERRREQGLPIPAGFQRTVPAHEWLKMIRIIKKHALDALQVGPYNKRVTIIYLVFSFFDRSNTTDHIR